MNPLGDVTALVLTVDEPYAPRALASVERQVPGVADVIVQRGVVPFHRAMNEGTRRVRTPYFVQVDADMILDADCCALLRACVAQNVGVVVGLLRDPLVGRVSGIKLFRTACFADERFPDSISPDTDFGNAIARRGWTTIYALRHPPTEPLHVFGDHAPDYTPLYTFRKHELIGARHRYRRSAQTLRELFRGLHASRHAAAPFAMIGTARGISLPAANDLLQPYRSGDDFERLERFLTADGAPGEPQSAVEALAGSDVREAWRRGYRCGLDLYRCGAAGALLASLRHLADDEGTVAWVAMIGICHGLFAERYEAEEVERAFTLVNQVLPYPYRLRLDGAA